MISINVRNIGIFSKEVKVDFSPPNNVKIDLGLLSESEQYEMATELFEAAYKLLGDNEDGFAEYMMGFLTDKLSIYKLRELCDILKNR